MFAGFSLWLLQLDCDSLRSLAPFGYPNQPSRCSASWSLSVEPVLVQSNPHPYILKKKKTTQVIFFPLAPPTGLRLAPLACTLRLSQSAFAMLGFLEPQCRTGSRPVQSSPLYTKKEEDHPSDLLPFGSSNWTRTSDTLINSQVLYRLSYGGIFNLQPPWAASL